MTNLVIHTDMPALSADEIVALAILNDRYVLSEQAWCDLLVDARGSHALRTFGECQYSLMEKGYVEIVPGSRVEELGLPLTRILYAANTKGSNVILKATFQPALADSEQVQELVEVEN